MINRTLLAGRVTRGPGIETEAGCCAFELTASHPRPADGEGRAQPPAEVLVEVLVPNPRQGETLRRWVETGQHLLVAGHLAPPVAGLIRVELESWQFLPDEVEAVDLREEAFAQGSARQAA